VLWLAIVAVCWIVLTAPRYALIPMNGKYVRRNVETMTVRKDFYSVYVDWGQVAQRSLPILLIALGLIYTLRSKTGR
jgi:hypothetical protein